ncbi:hypothetical protein TSAR_011278 [Trichomalopsis sarcophagae]|uniref:Uncharacterized protein n=1 Tax=Trichomalopsis sarcophagae TaxID=543379 RepID=A0A232EK10_9HYME|nr:hypothetical protein TSAR_011278 [Trichomalopsis sarcophagae]
MVICGGQQIIIKYFLRTPVDWSLSKRIIGTPPKIIALEYGRLDILVRLLKTEKLDERKTAYTNICGSNSLHYAISRGNYKATKILLEAGANPNSLDHFDQTPLEKACRESPEILNNHNPTERDLSPLPLRKTKCRAAIERRDRHKFTGSRRQMSSIHQNDDVLGTLINYKADWRVTCKPGENALHVAVGFGTPRALKIILERGNCHLDERNLLGATALKIAFRADAYEKMDTLLQKSDIRRTTNVENKITLKNYHPVLYKDFENACLEWQRTIETTFVREITFRDLVRKPISHLLEMSGTFAFQQQEGKFYYDRFPIYGSVIMKTTRRTSFQTEKFKNHSSKTKERNNTMK